MKAGTVVRKLLKAVPQSATWGRVSGEDYGPRNVAPDADVKKVLYCVTIGPAVEEYWHEGGYDLLVAHHPFRPRSPIPNVVLHTALDCAPGGLNDLWRDVLGLEGARPITGNLGWVGQVPEMAFDDLVARVRGFAGGIEGQLVWPAKTVRSVAICTGLGGFIAEEAAATGADVYVTGELTQPADSLGFDGVIEVGHTRSERVGGTTIQKLLGPKVRVDVAPLEIDRWAGEVFKGLEAAQGRRNGKAREGAGRTMRIPLTVDNEYLVAEFDGVRALVDTGAPFSFGTAPQIVVGGVVHPLPSKLLHLTIEELRALCGADFDVLLGTDILRQHPFTLDTERSEMVLEELPAGGHVEKVGLYMGSPYVTVEIGGQRVRCILDTGANIAFLPKDTPWPSPVCGERADFDPMFGRFVTPIRRCQARVLGQDLDLEFGELPKKLGSLLTLAGIPGLMGMELLETGRLGFDLGRSLVAYESRQ